MFWAALTVIANTLAQLLLKLGVRGSSAEIALIPINLLSVSAAGLYAIGLLFWANALKTLPLSSAYPLLASVIVLVSIFGMYVLKENLSILQWIALAVILAGILGFSAASYVK